MDSYWTTDIDRRIQLARRYPGIRVSSAERLERPNGESRMSLIARGTKKQFIAYGLATERMFEIYEAPWNVCKTNECGDSVYLRRVNESETLWEIHIVQGGQPSDGHGKCSFMTRKGAMQTAKLLSDIFHRTQKNT